MHLRPPLVAHSLGADGGRLISSLRVAMQKVEVRVPSAALEGPQKAGPCRSPATAWRGRATSGRAPSDAQEKPDSKQQREHGMEPRHGSDLPHSARARHCLAPRLGRSTLARLAQPSIARSGRHATGALPPAESARTVRAGARARMRRADSKPGPAGDNLPWQPRGEGVQARTLAGRRSAARRDRPRPLPTRRRPRRTERLASDG
jgi:hypothetical protein